MLPLSPRRQASISKPIARLARIDDVQLRVDALIRFEQTLAGGARRQIFARLEIARRDRIAISILQREA